MKTYWTDDVVRKSLYEICSQAGYFPPQPYFVNIGQQHLYAAAARRGGMARWWKEMETFGFTRKESNTSSGWNSELVVAEAIEQLSYNVIRIPGRKLHYDLMVEEVVRIEVKGAARLSYIRKGTGTNTSGWYFHLGKRPSSDLIVLHRTDMKDFFFIPWYFCPNSTITIVDSFDKHKKWHNNFGVLKEMVETRLVERSNIC